MEIGVEGCNKDGRLLVVSASWRVRSVLEEMFGRSQVITWADSLEAAAGLLERMYSLNLGDEPEVALVDLSITDFPDTSIQQRFAGAVGGATLLAVMPAACIGAGGPPPTDILEFYDFIRQPLVPWELNSRIKAALTFHRCRKNHFFEKLAVQIGAGLIVLDPAGRVLWFNPTAGELVGGDAKKLLGRPLECLESSTAAARTGHEMKSASLPEDGQPVTLRMTRLDGTWFWAECFARDIALPAGTGTILLFMDISGRKGPGIENGLAAKVFECSGEAIMITDRQDRILCINPAFTKATGYLLDEVAGRSPAFLNSGRQDKSFYDRMWATVHRDGHWKGEVWNRRKSGELYPEWMAVTAVRSQTGRIDHHITILSDITDRLANEEHLRYLAQHDFLTGLPNRALLQDRFTQAVANARRHAHKIALMFLDLDNFKEVNDRYGHFTGDQLLQELAQRLSAAVRSGDTVSRYGGDEFILLLPEIQGPDVEAEVVMKIKKHLQEPFAIDGHEFCLSASIGISIYPSDGQDLNELLSRADAAMYAVKNRGSRVAGKHPAV